MTIFLEGLIWVNPEDPEDLKRGLTFAADGWPEAIRVLLDHRADPNGMPLIMAIQCDEVEIVRRMVEVGADVNYDFSETTPLVHAVSGTNPEIVKLLIEAGADVNKRSKEGITPLAVA
jgi:ankyrin repeat protein